MADKIEFASDAWLEKLKGLLGKYTAMVGPELELSICEVFTGVPANLDKHGDGVLAWHCRIAEGKVSFAEGEIAEADIKTVADYDFVLAMARMKLEESTMAAYQELQEKGAASGKLAGSGDKSKVPPAFYGMHNELAEITA